MLDHFFPRLPLAERTFNREAPFLLTRFHDGNGDFQYKFCVHGDRLVLGRKQHEGPVVSLDGEGSEGFLQAFLECVERDTFIGPYRGYVNHTLEAIRSWDWLQSESMSGPRGI